MTEFMEKFLYDSNFFIGIIGFIIGAPFVIYLIYKFIKELHEMTKRPKTKFEFPAITIRKAQHEWAKDYLKKKEEKRNGDL